MRWVGALAANSLLTSQTDPFFMYVVPAGQSKSNFYNLHAIVHYLQDEKRFKTLIFEKVSHLRHLNHQQIHPISTGYTHLFLKNSKL